jgi:hypothetical protein
MNINFPKIFQHFDEVAGCVTGRVLTDDEKAVTHASIVDTFHVARREKIPFAAAFEKTYPLMPARMDFPEVYEVLRRKRGHIEGLLEGKREMPERKGQYDLDETLRTIPD